MKKMPTLVALGYASTIALILLLLLDVFLCVFPPKGGTAERLQPSNKYVVMFDGEGRKMFVTNPFNGGLFFSSRYVVVTARVDNVILSDLGEGWKFQVDRFVDSNTREVKFTFIE